MSSTFMCSRDGKEYVESDVVMINSVPVAKVNLTDVEKLKFGVTAAPAAEPETPKEPEAPQSSEPAIPESGSSEGDQGIPASVPEGSLPPNDEGVQTPPADENLG